MRKTSLIRKSRSVLLGALLSCSLAASAACGGAKTPAFRYTPTTPEQERVFEHGVDFVAALEGIEGKWREDWDKDLQERVGSADFIGVIRVTALFSETDPEQKVTHRLVGKVKRTIFGEVKGDLELRVREDQAGFTTIHDNLSRIESAEYVAFVKWYQGDNGEQAAHFHLSPASDQVLAETEHTAALKQRAPTNKEPTERVVVHTN